MTPRIEAGEWIRNPARNRSFAFVWGGLAVITAVPATVLVVRALQRDQVVGSLVIAAVFGIPAIFAGRYAFGAARAGLLVTEETVVLRNPLSTREVPVTELRSFGAGRQPSAWWLPYRSDPTPGIVLELKDASVYSVWTLATDAFARNAGKRVAEWTDVAAELNALTSRGL